jgi:hypothetical protein
MDGQSMYSGWERNGQTTYVGKSIGRISFGRLD